MYTDMREEARDHARVRNAYFDQVNSQGYAEKMDGLSAGRSLFWRVLEILAAATHILVFAFLVCYWLVSSIVPSR
jgi:hypothetical protein